MLRASLKTVARENGEKGCKNKKRRKEWNKNMIDVENF